MGEEERVFFNSDEACKEFFSKFKEAHSLRSWRELAIRYGIRNSSFDSYRSGKYSLPACLFDKLLQSLPREDREYFFKQVFSRPNNWGAVLGGKVTSSRYPEEYARRRAKGLKKILSQKQSIIVRFNPKMKLSLGLCEFVGALIGDGFTSGNKRRCHTEFTGDKFLDRKYHQHLSAIAFSVFGLKPYVNIYKKRNVIRTIFNSRQLHEFLVERFHFPKGVKCYTVKLPDEILIAGDEYIFRTIRGIFDTDGCVFLDKRPIYAKPYPRISFTTVSKSLYLQLSEVLGEYFSLYTSERKNRRAFVIEIYGEAQVKKWMELIGFSNPRHLRKICLINKKPQEGFEPSTSRLPSGCLSRPSASRELSTH